MSTKPNSNSDQDQANIYQIRVKGHLDPEWTDWFGHMKITREEDGTTLISGPVLDDAALHGLLKVVRDSGMQLLSVNTVESEPSAVKDAEPKSGTTDQISN